MQDENGNNLFFIAIGYATRYSELDNGYDEWDNNDNIRMITSLPHSLFDEPSNYDLIFTDDEAESLFCYPHRTSYGSDGEENWYKQSFAVIWLTDHHFSIVSEWYDITDEICNLFKSHPDYGNKYLDEFITKGNNFENPIAASTLMLRDKERFLRAISCEPPQDTGKFYKIISDALETELVTWNEVIPQIGRFMGKFDYNQKKFFSNIKDTSVKLNFFNEIKKSANFQSTGLKRWLKAHKEVNCSIDYIFENFDQKDDDSNIELFDYCLHHQLLQKALECGTYLTSRFHSIFYSRSKSTFCDVIFNFIKLNDGDCLRSLIEFLLQNDDAPKECRMKKGKLELVWNKITANTEKSSKLIPFIFDVLGHNVTLNIPQSTLFIIFNLMLDCDEKKIFISSNQFYNLLFNRIKFNDSFYHSYYRFDDRSKVKVLLANKIVEIGDELNHKSFAIHVLDTNYWKSKRKFKLTKSFSNILCDNFLTRNKSAKEFLEMSRFLIVGNIDNDRLNNLLVASSSINTKVVLLISEIILACGRANGCNVCSVLADCLMKKGKEKIHKNFFYFLLRVVRNDDAGAKFLHAIDLTINDNSNLVKKKVNLVDKLLFKSGLHLPDNTFNYSSEFLLRIENLISFEIEYLKTTRLASWRYPDNFMVLETQQPLRQGIFKFLKQDIQSAHFGKGSFTSTTQVNKEVSDIKRRIPDIAVKIIGSNSSAYYTILKKKKFGDPDKTNKKIQNLLSMLTSITSNLDELKNFGLPVISARPPCEDEPSMKETRL